jgi:PAS domain-containing protein
MSSQSVELILARNLVSSIQLASILVDPDGVVVFFNDAAGELIGHTFDEVGPLPRDEWNSRFGPFDELGEVIPTGDMPLTIALRTGLPVNARFHIRVGGGDLDEVEVSALPLSGADGFKGALVVFWRADDDE